MKAKYPVIALVVPARYEEEVISFRYILVTTLVVAVLLPTCMTTIPLLYMLRSKIKSGAERELHLKAEKIGIEVKHELWLIAQHTLDLSKDSGLRALRLEQLRSENVQPLLKDYLSANPAIAQIVLLSPRGKALNVWPGKRREVEIRPQWLAWLRQADLSDGQINHSNLQVLPEDEEGYVERLEQSLGKVRGTIRSSRFFSFFVPMRDSQKNEIKSILLAILPMESLALCHQWRAPKGGWVDFFDGPQDVLKRTASDISQKAPKQIFASSDIEITHGAMGRDIPLTIQVSEPSDVGLLALKNELLPVLFAFAEALVVVSFLAYLLSGKLAAPIKRLVDHARLIGSGKYDSPPPKLRFMELDELATTLGELGSRITEEIRRRVEQERQKSELERTRAESVLNSLLKQVQPHFLFNCLNGIAAVIPTDPDKASKMTQSLSDLYRFILDATKTNTSPLERELQIVKEYLELQKMRYGERLAYEIEVPSPIPAIFLPSLMLQTLAENAVKHGISKWRAGGQIAIRVSPREGNFEINITNTGAPLTVGSKGTGLENTRARLDLLHGDGHQFSIFSNPQGQTEVQFFIPGVNL